MGRAAHPQSGHGARRALPSLGLRGAPTEGNDAFVMGSALCPGRGSLPTVPVFPPVTDVLGLSQVTCAVASLWTAPHLPLPLPLTSCYKVLTSVLAVWWPNPGNQSPSERRHGQLLVTSWSLRASSGSVSGRVRVSGCVHGRGRGLPVTLPAPPDTGSQGAGARPHAGLVALLLGSARLSRGLRGSKWLLFGTFGLRSLSRAALLAWATALSTSPAWNVPQPPATHPKSGPSHPHAPPGAPAGPEATMWRDCLVAGPEGLSAGTWDALSVRSLG